MMDKVKNKSAFGTSISRDFRVDSMGLVLILLMTILSTNGCSKKNTSSSPAASQDAQTNQPAAPAAQAAPPPTGDQPAVSSSTQSNGEPDLRALDRTLIRWMVRNKRRPADFQEFASSAGAPIPPAPPGKKYVFGPNMHIQLVNQ